MIEGKTTFVQAMLDFFGRLPGQSLMDFHTEIKALTPEDRAYFTAGLAGIGYQFH